jgi:acyl-[acyl-carrier-protein]-phospholipid O-acyltransferase/long-chain-fatty-acid--[acyl-carrier-protein] ligase
MKIEHLRDVFEFLDSKKSWRIIFDLFVMSACLGIYAVPLYASIQHYSAPAFRSRIVAACNLVDSAFMIFSSVFIMALSSFGFSTTNILLIVFLMNLAVSVQIYRIVPVSETIHRKLSKKIWNLIFGVTS